MTYPIGNFWHSWAVFWRRFSLTEGEQCLLLAYSIVCVFGGGIAFVVLTRLTGQNLFTEGLNFYGKWVMFAGALGAGAALYICRGRMGQSGISGAANAVWSAVLVTAVGAVIAGTLALPLYGTMFGPFTFFMAMLGSPFLALTWFGNLIAAHMLIREWRNEQARYDRRMS